MLHVLHANTTICPSRGSYLEINGNYPTLDAGQRITPQLVENTFCQDHSVLCKPQISKSTVGKIQGNGKEFQE